MKPSKFFFFLLTVTMVLFSTCKKEDTLDDEQLLNERALGAIPATQAQLDSIPIVDTAVLFAERLIQLPSTFALEMPPIKDQGGEGSCAAFAAAYALRGYHLHKDLNKPYTNSNVLDENAVFSPEYVYNSAKLPGTCRDAGMYLSSALYLLKDEGVSTWAAMPYSSSNGCSTLPNASQKANAASHKIKGFARITNLSTDYLKWIIFRGYPIFFGAKVDNGFWRYGNFIWNSRHGNNVGGHAMVICGWDDTKNAYKIMNSWGTGWGFDGFGWIDYDYFNTVVAGSPDYYEMYLIQTFGAGCDGITSVTDIDGNVYGVVKIGNQCWMKENLRVSAGIAEVSDSLQWANIYYSGSQTPAWCYYNNDPANGSTYGKLYNWYAVNTGNLCPSGWHIPTDAEWQQLVDALRGDAVAGGAMKSTTGWNAPNTDATNSSGFTALPGGYRFSDGNFNNVGDAGYFLSSTEHSTINVWFWNRKLSYLDSYVHHNYTDKQIGFSCRCLRD